MQTARLVQAVIVMLIMAFAASCAVTKEYSSKLFAPGTAKSDSQYLTLRFLELDSNEKSTEDWVTTDIIRGIDTSTSTVALDNLAKFIVADPKKDSMQLKKTGRPEIPDVVKSKEDNPKNEPIARNSNTDGVRSKKKREE